MMNVESFIQNYISYRKLYRGLDNGVEFGYLPVTGITAAGGGASGSAIALVNAINNSDA